MTVSKGSFTFGVLSFIDYMFVCLFIGGAGIVGLLVQSLLAATICQNQEEETFYAQPCTIYVT